MFYPGLPDQVYIATGATDMRKSINGLSILVAEQLFSQSIVRPPVLFL